MPMAPELEDKNQVQHDFWSCDTTGTSVGILWYQYHYAQQHYIVRLRLLQLGAM